MKVQDLAKDLGQSTKELIRFLYDVGIKVKSGNTRLDESTIEEVRELFKGESVEEKRKSELSGQRLPATTITVKELADLLKVSLTEIMKVVLSKGLLLNLNSEIDEDLAIDLAKNFEVELLPSDAKAGSQDVRKSLDKIFEQDIDTHANTLAIRPPVVTIMGHVDHGKTLLLDTIRKTNVVAGEAGGITQHIGAYQVSINKRKITFLDTPGHAAFTALRARGAQVTDIAILVVAATEGVKPQTIEAIHHAKDAGIPIIVAINKMDLPDANPDQVKTELSQHDLVSEDWGGKVPMVPISAKKKMGIEELLEMILITADLLEIKARFEGYAKGVVIESKLSRKKGPVATILVKSGTLKIGDNFVVGAIAGKVRAMLDDRGDNIESAEPGTPVELLGINTVPQPGAILEVVESEKAAQKLAQTRAIEEKQRQQSFSRKVTLDTVSQQTEEGETRRLNIILRADVNGSLEAIRSSIDQIQSQDVEVHVIHAATGSVTETDIMLAKASSALIVAFNVPESSEMTILGQRENVTIKQYSVIYNIIEDVTKAIEGLFKIEYEDVEIGKIEVRQIFNFSKVGTIAGSYVTSGKAIRNLPIRVFRNDEQLFEGKLTSLKRFQEDVKEVQSGYECGVVVDGFTSFKEGDQIIVFENRIKS